MPATKKATTRKTAAKATTRTRRTRNTAPAKPMSPAMRELAAAVLGFATERAMASEKLGVVGTASKELKGRRSGTATILRFDDGTRATVTFAVRGK